MSRDCLTKTFRPQLGVLATQKQDELFSAEAERMGLRVGLEDLCHGFKHLVADPVAVTVIDRLEMVEVEYGQRAKTRRAICLEILFDCPPIEQSS